jgi:hypothetical protein
MCKGRRGRGRWGWKSSHHASGSAQRRGPNSGGEYRHGVVLSVGRQQQRRRRSAVLPPTAFEPGRLL